MSDSPKFRIPADPEVERLHAEYLAAEKAALLAHGKPNVRHVASRGVYAFYSGKHYVVTGQSFDFEAEAWDYLRETHGIEKPASKTRKR
jgi:hypothetical protein